jgi:hypothetical protein
LEKLAKGMKWEEHILQTTRGQNEALSLKDFDGDGVPEVFVNCWDKKAPVVAWRLTRDEQQRPSAARIVLGEEGGGHGYGFGDLNGDGREDLLCETGWYERPAGPPLASPWKKHRFVLEGQETDLPHPSCPCLVVDLTGDGRQDIILGKAHDFGLFWWEQQPPLADGRLSFRQHLIDDSWSQPHALAWADLDGDGRRELLAGKRVRAHNGRDPGGLEAECLYYYHWDEASRRFTRHTLSPPGGGVGGGMQICVADLNGDHLPDVAVAGKTGTWVLINRGRER